MTALLESSKIQKLFDSIAGRYDFLNSLLSFRLDVDWRRKSRDAVLEGGERTVLDLGTGTGKFLRQFLEKGTWQAVVGLDFSAGMLEVARRTLPGSVSLLRGDFEALPFKEASFDLVISAFTLRSVGDMPRFLKGVRAVLKKGGKTALLCLTRPSDPRMKFFYGPYMKFYLPWMGQIFAKNKEAYRFLSDSVLSFQDPEKTAGMMKAAGFCDVVLRPFSGGLATLFVGRK
jgi:demethylmenaquinone methyltransferase/2-methoxy-6-polyprenyl-1,4-benzoquinol methylase